MNTYSGSKLISAAKNIPSISVHHHFVSNQSTITGFVQKCYFKNGNKFTQILKHGDLYKHPNRNASEQIILLILHTVHFFRVNGQI